MHPRADSEAHIPCPGLTETPRAASLQNGLLAFLPPSSSGDGPPSGCLSSPPQPPEPLCGKPPSWGNVLVPQAPGQG